MCNINAETRFKNEINGGYITKESILEKFMGVEIGEIAFNVSVVSPLANTSIYEKKYKLNQTIYSNTNTRSTENIEDIFR